MQHRHHAYREVSCNSPANLEKSDSTFVSSCVCVPFCKVHHVFNPATDSVYILHITGDDVTCKHISQGRILPAGYDNRDVLFGRFKQPAVLWIDLIRIFQLTRKQDFIEKLMWKKRFAG